MKNKIIFCSALVGLLTVSSFLGSCGENPSTSSEPTTTPVISSDLPTTLPDIKGDKVAIHYFREDNKYKDWDVWLWQEGNVDFPGAGFDFNYINEYGAAAIFSAGTLDVKKDIGFIIRKGGSGWAEKDTSADRFFTLSTYEKDENGIRNIYCVSEDETIYSSGASSRGGKVLAAEFTSFTKINFQTNVLINKVNLFKNDETTAIISAPITSSIKNFNVEFERVLASFKVELGNNYYISVNFVKADALGITISERKRVSITRLYNTTEFSSLYNYDGELGAIYTSASTTFKVWSPFSAALKLNVYESGTPKAISESLGNDTKTTYDMTGGTPNEKGLWSYKVDGDLHGKYYTFTVINHLGTHEITDPYAVSAGINGIRGMILDLNKTNPIGWSEFKSPSIKNTQTVIYETHVADVTSSSSWGGSADNSKKYLGLIEKNTVFTDKDKVAHPTGFDHIIKLGINALHLLPIFDQDNDETNPSYNWGYNPLNYNVLEGSYSSDPYDGAKRVNEMKQVVMAYGTLGVKIIMDVVYNHVANLETSNFNYLLPGYYFRYNGVNPSNGSGCGNETASENYMFRKFMCDSTKFLATTYKLGGFRFDLMGLHDVETMNKVRANLNSYDPLITVYGEPWTGGSSPLPGSDKADSANIYKLNDIAAFSDSFRNAVKGTNGAKDVGWVNKDGGDPSQYNAIVDGIKGKGKTSNPQQTINYVSCHDNNSLYDKLVLSTEDETVRPTEEELVKMDILAAGLTFSSQGMTFMQGGEELGREKFDEEGKRVENSYNSSYKTNEINYAHLGNPQFNKLFEFYKSYISTKIQMGILNLDTSDEISKNLTMIETSSKNVIAFKYNLPESLHLEESGVIFVFANRGAKDVEIPLTNGIFNVVSDSNNLTPLVDPLLITSLKVTGLRSMIISVTPAV
ncbi:MAG: type I pullulanase [Bacilli bacterium]